MNRIREPLGRSGVDGVESDATPEERAELLARIRRGDGDAFDRIAREQAPRLFRLALRLTGRREEAEDLVQETLVRALPKLPEFRGDARISTYLVRALTNLWKNGLRSKSRSRLVDWFRLGRRSDEPEGDDQAPDPPEHAPSALDRIESDETAGEVRAAVQRLEPNRRLALLLREVEEMSYEEIAEMTGVPVGTVRSRLARARDDLRREMTRTER